MRPAISPWIVALLALGATACANLAAIEDDGCGNRVINEEEDCDGTSPLGGSTACGEPNTANACFFVCEGDRVECPDGWGCGGDLRCRRPSGDFTSVAGDKLVLDTFAVGDMDGDEVLDIVGNHGPIVSVRYGDGGGRFPAGFDQPVPQPTGEITFGDLDQGDGGMDLVAPISLGIFALLGTDARTLEPFNYAPFAVPTSMGAMPPDHGRVLAVQAKLDDPGGVPRVGEALFLLDENRMLIDFAAPRPNTVPLMDRDRADRLTQELPVADLDGDGTTEIALLYRGHSKVYFHETTTVGGELALIADQVANLEGHTIADPGGFFADLDQDGDLDLLVSVRETNGGRDRVAVYYQTAPGEFENPATFDHVLDSDEACRQLPELADTRPLAAVRLDDDPYMDYVLPRGIALGSAPTAGCPNGTLRTFNGPVASNRWDMARIVDINADGKPDVVASSFLEPGVDILLNNSRAELPVFTAFHRSTSAATKLLATGDFNGDLVPDLAIVEDGQGQRADRLLVVFGAYFGDPSEPVDMGALGVVESMAGVDTSLGLNDTDIATDLITITRPFTGAGGPPTPLSLALVFGDSSRKMLAPFQTFPLPGYRPSATVLGQFGDRGGTMAGDDGVDVAVILTPRGGDAQDSSSDFVLMAAGRGTDGDLDSQVRDIARLPPRAMFDARCARWAAGPLGSGESAGPPVLVGVDAGSSCRDGGSFTPRLLLSSDLGTFITPLEGSMGPPMSDPLTDALPLDVTVSPFDFQATAIERLALMDIDGDVDLDLLLIFTQDGGASSSIIILWNNPDRCGMKRLCPDAFTRIDIADLDASQFGRILDAEPLQLDDDAPPEMAVLTDKGVLLVQLDLDTLSYGAQGWLEEPEPRGPADEFGSVRAADLNDDGLLDLVTNTEGRIHVYIQEPTDPYGKELANADIDAGTDAGADAGADAGTDAATEVTP